VIDPRPFDVMVRGVVQGTYPVKEAREVATILRSKEVGVTLRNAETGHTFKWWPELGGALKDPYRIITRDFMVRMLHNH
jgi:hypothetical protein